MYAVQMSNRTLEQKQIHISIFLLDPGLRICCAIFIKQKETYMDSTPKSEKEEEEHVAIVLRQIY